MLGQSSVGVEVDPRFGRVLSADVCGDFDSECTVMSTSVSAHVGNVQPLRISSNMAATRFISWVNRSIIVENRGCDVLGSQHNVNDRYVSKCNKLI